MRNTVFLGSRTSIGGSGGGSIPDRALSFTRASSQRLSMSLSNFGSFNRAKFAFSVWVKRVSTGTQQAILDMQDSGFGNKMLNIVFNTSNKIIFRVSSDGSTYGEGQLTTTNTYTSTAAWYHLLFHYDSANTQMKLWVNGTQETGFDVEVYPSNSIYNGSSALTTIGSRTTLDYFDGLIYQPAFFSGSLPGIGSVYNSGAPINVQGLTGLWSLLHTMNGGSLEDDYIRTTNWTNDNSVITSTTVP